MHVVTDKRTDVAFSICACGWRSATFHHTPLCGPVERAGFALVQLAEHVLIGCSWNG